MRLPSRFRIWQMDETLADGRIRGYCLGRTLDASASAGDLLTVAVSEPELYDSLLSDHVDRNDGT
jgi:hypothetical protein